MRPARTETYEHTISGLLSKRAHLFNEAIRLRARTAKFGKPGNSGCASKALRILKEGGDVRSAVDTKGNLNVEQKKFA